MPWQVVSLAGQPAREIELVHVIPVPKATVGYFIRGDVTTVL